MPTRLRVVTFYLAAESDVRALNQWKTSLFLWGRRIGIVTCSLSLTFYDSKKQKIACEVEESATITPKSSVPVLPVDLR